MLTYEISRYEKPPSEKKPRFINGSLEHREYIFNRNLAHVRLDPQFKRGRSFFIKGRKEKGLLIDILEDFNSIEWDGLKVKFLELWFPMEKTTRLYHQADLEK